jgi:hypothetical protein
MPLADAVGVPNCIPLILPPASTSHQNDQADKMRTDTKVQEDRINKDFKRKMSELRSELTCSICQDPFLLTNTLECGHSYCQPCVDSWLAKHLTCPICRAPVNKPPTQSLTIDKAVEVTLQSSNKAALKALLVRQQEYQEKKKQDLEHRKALEKQLQDASAKGHKFCNIAKPWSDKEQCRFLKGLKYQQGLSRITYCTCVCLTERFIQRASLKDLIIAARNVKLGSNEKSVECMDAVSLRNRLNMFLKYC